MNLARPAAALACALAIGLTHAAHARRQQQQGHNQPEPGAAGQVRQPTMNVLPFVRLAERGRKLFEEGRLGPATTLDVTATAELDGDGSLKPESVKVDWRAAADEEVMRLAQQLLAAIDESRVLAVLDNDARPIRLTARLDRVNVTLGLETEYRSETEAANTSRGLDAMLSIGRRVKEGMPEGRLYEALKVASDGKAFGLTFEMPKEAAAKMVADMLDKQAARGRD